VRGPGHRFTAHRRSQNKRRTIAGKRKQATGWEFVHVMVEGPLAGSPTPRCSRARARMPARRSPFSDADSPSSKNTVSRSSGSCRTTARATSQRRTRSPAERSVSVTPAFAPAAPAPTGSGALHPDTAQRMGLRPHLRQLRRAPTPARPQPQALQLHTTTRLPRQATTHLTADQPAQELQLAPLREPLLWRGFDVRGR
jgi:hypothetical protein